MTSSFLLALSPVPETDSSSLIRLLVFLAIFVGPAILKGLRESQKKKREAAARGNQGPPALETRPSRTEEPDELDLQEDEEEADVAGGRERWEQLLRGEAPTVPPPVPPPIPVPAPARRRVLTESPPLTAEPALTDSAPLTSARTPEVAQPHASYEVTPSYDAGGAEKSRLGREFEQFAPQQGLASDRKGGPAKQVGETPTFAGSGAFRDLQPAAGLGALEQGEIGGAAGVASRRRRSRLRLARSDWKNSVLAAEVLGAPLALRAFESGPTRPLGWS